MGLTQNINGFECELMIRDDVLALIDTSDACSGCPLNPRYTGTPCFRGQSSYPCQQAAGAAGYYYADNCYWFSPVVYELNKE